MTAPIPKHPGDVTSYRRLSASEAVHPCDAPACYELVAWRVTFWQRGHLDLCREHKDLVKTRKGGA